MIKLYNTKTRKKELFVPLDPANVRMYVCGPTVYDRAHLGNARPVIVFDVLYRLLRHVYGADHVTYVRNFTDVDDRINQTAVDRRAAGAAGSLVDLIRARSDETIEWYHQDMDAVGALRPDHEPRATEWIGAMVAMIVDLIGKGHAYEAEGHVLFAVESYSAYGALSGRSIDDMIAGARVEVAPYKRNPMDFVLWKPSGDELPGWDSPWGRGRPGWHIECSAMAHELLGASFDIHAGGIDLQFPHHENEIAQSACAHPEGGFASVWMHNEMLQVEGKKMSKSLDNFFTVRDLLDQGVPGEVIRFVMLSTHYGKPMDWRRKAVFDARTTLRKWYDAVGEVVSAASPDPIFLGHAFDDLNSPNAISVLHDLYKKRKYASLKASAQLFGLLSAKDDRWYLPKIDPSTEIKLHKVLDARTVAREKKDFAKSDFLRAVLAVAGVVVADGSSVRHKLSFAHLESGWARLFEFENVGKFSLDHVDLEKMTLIRGIQVSSAHESDGFVGDGWNVVVGSYPDTVDEQLLDLAGLAGKVE